MRGLYAIVDVGALGRCLPSSPRRAPSADVLAFAEAILEARPAAVQLRDKHGSPSEMLELLRGLVPLSARAGVPLYANDRPDLAALAGCAGVHLGQGDVPATVARQVAARSGRALQVGLSSHDAAEVDAALAAQPDYLAIGPVFATHNKERPAPVLGIPGLQDLAARARSARPRLDLVGIGGVTVTRAAEVAAVCEAVAVIGALLPPPVRGHSLDAAALADVRGRAAALVSAIHGARGRDITEAK